jgi:S1-C subfamily serine protease
MPLGNLGVIVAPQGRRLGVTHVLAGQLGNSGFQVGDQVISVGGTTVATARQLLSQLTAAPANDGFVAVRIDRGGQPRTVQLDLLALRLGTQLAEQNGIVQFSGITIDSPAAVARVNAGDQIVFINGERVSSLADARAKLNAATRFSGEATLTIRRGGALEFAHVRPSDITGVPPE